MATRSQYDFRRWRYKLRDYMFLISGKREKPPLNLRIDKDTWQGIVHLPDDVSLRTSDYFGPQLQSAYKIACSWWDMFDDIPDNDPELAPLREFIISNYAECDASIFSALVGYYRQAGASLRFVLEALLSGIYFSLTPEKRGEFERHKKGDATVAIPALGQVRDQMYATRSFIQLNDWLAKKGQPKFLDSKPIGFIKSLYNELTEFSHGRMGLLSEDGDIVSFSNADMWASNGPVLVGSEFLRWFDLYCATMFCCGGLARVYVLKDGSLTKEYLAAYRATMNLHLTKVARQRVLPLIEYLTKNVIV